MEDKPAQQPPAAVVAQQSAASVVFLGPAVTATSSSREPFDLAGDCDLPVFPGDKAPAWAHGPSTLAETSSPGGGVPDDLAVTSPHGMKALSEAWASGSPRAVRPPDTGSSGDQQHLEREDASPTQPAADDDARSCGSSQAATELCPEEDGQNQAYLTGAPVLPTVHASHSGHAMGGNFRGEDAAKLAPNGSPRQNSELLLGNSSMAKPSTIQARLQAHYKASQLPAGESPEGGSMRPRAQVVADLKSTRKCSQSDPFWTNAFNSEAGSQDAAGSLVASLRAAATGHEPFTCFDVVEGVHINNTDEIIQDADLTMVHIQSWDQKLEWRSFLSESVAMSRARQMYISVDVEPDPPRYARPPPSLPTAESQTADLWPASPPSASPGSRAPIGWRGPMPCIAPEGAAWSPLAVVGTRSGKSSGLTSPRGL